MVFGGKRRRRGGLSEEQAREVCAAARALGVAEPRWTREGGVFAVAGRECALTARELRRASRRRPEVGGMIPDAIAGAIGLAAALGVQPPAELVGDFGTIRGLLMPRLYSTRELSGPRRGMCRREAFGGAGGELVRALAVGDGVGAPVVTTAALDRWPVEFDEGWRVAEENLVERIGPESLDELKGVEGVVALIDGRVPGSSGALAPGALFDSGEIEHGVVFAVPRSETLLAMVVREGSGAMALGALVQATHTLVAESEGWLSDQIFWWRGGEYFHLPMTAIFESRSKRVHIEARGAVEELLRVLGVVE